MIILGIETSCDETALCLLETRQTKTVENDGHKNAMTESNLEYRILGNIVHSQIDLHREYGGVFPALAKREHIKNLPILYKKLLEKNKTEASQIQAIAVTHGPGLEPALWTGIDFARELSSKLSVPLIPVNHMEGHIISTFFESSTPSAKFKELKTVTFPALALLISGGHTEIVGIEKLGSYEILGQTKDDAVGEAFDKVARMLGLPYPGGPEISRLAEEERSAQEMRKEKNRRVIAPISKTASRKPITLPRPMLHSKDLNMSFSGLKTSVLYLLKNIEKENMTEDIRKEIAREFEDSVTEVLVKKTREALENHECKSLIIGGGVIANTHIRQAFEKLSSEYSIPLYLPAKGLTGDNALMIALSGALTPDVPSAQSPLNIKAHGNLSL